MGARRDAGSAAWDSVAIMVKRVRAVGLNHVSVHAVDLEASTRFYCDVLGLRKLRTPSFAFPVQWLELGGQQLHLFQRDGHEVAPRFHHLAVTVDEFESTYELAHELGIHDAEAFFSDIYELPDGSVQMYIRDPAGNLVEIDWPDVSTLDRSRLPPLKKLSDSVPQAPESSGATLYHRRDQHDGAR
jgi:YD repeat-containing protein